MNRQAEVDALSLDEELLDPESLDEADEAALDPESLDEVDDELVDEVDAPDRVSVL